MDNYLFIDVETYSDFDIKLCGAYKYVESPNFEIMLFAYAFNNDEVKIVDMTIDKIPEKVYLALTDPNIIKVSHNANFERNAIKSHFNLEMQPEQWHCSMVKALTLGLPGSLDAIGKVLNFGDDKQKLRAGRALVLFFCKPCKPTKRNNLITRNLANENIEKWELFKTYCVQDVVSMCAIWNMTSKYITIETEQKLWNLDQKVNDTGVGIDIDFVNQAIKCDAQYTQRLKVEAKELTGLSNPNSPAQLKVWIGERLGHEVTSLTKDSISDLLEEAEDDGVKRILELRQLMAKTSIKKYKCMKNAFCKDHRSHGLLQFYGANRTGRWSGKLIQVQNLPKNHIPDLDYARDCVKQGRFDEVEFLFDSVPDTLSQLIRTAFIPRQGNRFIVSDFSAIEARVIAWFAGETWRMKVFATHGKIYEASASQMFKVPIESITKGSPLRQKGKISELALGYGGSVGALTAMGALKMGVKEDELKGLVDKWRESNIHITKFWWDCDKAAKKAINEKTTVCLQFGLKFIYDPGVLFIQLPSGRKLSYIRPKIAEGKFGKPVITYEGMEQTSKQWTTLETYGPKIVENIVQATARDCLGEAMVKVEKANYHIVMHVHDEVILDTPRNKGSLEEVNAIFGEPIDWAPGLPLKADGYETDYYKKD